MAGKKLGTVLEKINCKECGKKVEVIRVVGGSTVTKYAPCECTCENIISVEQWERGPAEVDIINEKEVIQHIRDLLNLSDLLKNDLDEELLNFIHTLKKSGYGDISIHKFITYAGYGTRYETLTDGYGDKIVPRALPEKGEYTEWLRLKQRAK